MKFLVSFFLFNEFTNIFVPAASAVSGSIWLRFAFGT